MLYNMQGIDKCENEKPMARPYVPEGRVSMMIVSGDMPIEMTKRLHSCVSNIIRTPELANLPRPICSHPDMQMVIPLEGVIIHAPNLDAALAQSLKNTGFMMVPGEKCPNGTYPSDIPYNAAVIGKRAFLNTRFSDARVMEYLKKAGISISHVNQGYAKCSTLIVNNDALITSDHGIFNAARAQNMDVLLIPPQKKIVIDGFDHGFIGGASGLISKTEIVFAGGFDKLDDAETIERFLGKYGIKPVSLGMGDVLDIGSLIPLCSV